MSDGLSVPQPPEPPRLDVHRLLMGTVGALAATTIIVLSIGRFAGFADLGDTLDDASWWWLAVCVGGQIAVFVGYGGVFRTSLAFEHGPEVSTRFSLRVVLASFGLTQLIAAGGAAGLAFTYWVLRRLGIAQHDAAVRLVALNTAVYLVFALIGWLAAGFGLLDDAVPLGLSLPWLFVVPMVLLAARWFTQPSRVADWVGIGNGPMRTALSIGVAAAAWVRRAVQTPDGRRVVAWAALYWAGDLVSLWAALRAFGASPSPQALALAYTTGYLAQAVPVPLIATGGVDAATTLTLTAVGVPVEMALLGVVAHRVFAFWLPIVPGLWSAGSIVREHRRTATA